MDKENSERDAPHLQRTLGLASCTVTGVGVILGAGIYALVGKAAALAGSGVWISFVAAAVMAGLTGLGYAELASFIPRAGGEYHFTHRAFGAAPAFLVSWLLLAGLTVASAAVALGFAGYSAVLVDWPQPAIAVLVLALCAAVLLWGIRESVRIAAICTMAEVCGLLLVIVVGIPKLGEVDLLAAPNGLAGIGSASALIFFAYIGFEEIVQLAEEAQNPTRTIPSAVLLAIAITTVLYVSVSIAAVAVLGEEKLSQSSAPLADVVSQAIGSRARHVIVVIALMATFNTALVLMLSAARLAWGMAEDGALPSGLSRIHATRHTPWVATGTIAALAAGVVLVFRRIELIANVTNFALFVTFLVINGAVIGLRFREPDAPRAFRLPGAIAGVPLIPLAGIVTVLVLLRYVEARAIWLGIALLAAGLLARCGMVYWTGRRQLGAAPAALGGTAAGGRPLPNAQPSKERRA